jgi:DNA mismatch repair protein MutL
MSIRSRVAESDEGAEIRSDGGERTQPEPCGMPVGTQIEVRNLFFNTPVRRKYMKAITTEFGHITETFIRMVLPLPNIYFTLKHNSRVVYDLPPNESPQARIRQLFGEDIAKDLIHVESRPDAVVKVHGFVSHPNQSRMNNKMQYFFLNNRFIRDRSLQHALGEAYRGLLTVGRFPVAFLQIELSPDLFDVNVHPTKMEVRFLNSSQIYSGFLSTIRERFLSSGAELRGRFQGSSQHPAEPTQTNNNPPPWESDNSESAGDNIRHNNSNHPNDPRGAMNNSGNDEIQDWLGTINKPEKTTEVEPDAFALNPLNPETTPPLPENPSPKYSIPTQSTSSLSSSSSSSSSSLSSTSSSFPISVTPPEYPEDEPPEPISTSPSERVAYSPQGKLVVQMHDSYLLLETSQGIAVIDQHALHERILYEQLKKEMNDGKMDSQRLLIPIPVDLAPNEFACTLENIDFFKTLGLEVQSFGGETVLISAFPAIFSKTPPQEILFSLIEPLLEAGKKIDRTELLDKMLHSMACKAAVKAGDRLCADAITRLIELAEKEIYAHHCPHGRPSTLIFTREEIDKMFKRT